MRTLDKGSSMKKSEGSEIPEGSEEKGTKGHGHARHLGRNRPPHAEAFDRYVAEIDVVTIRRRGVSTEREPT